MRRRAVLPACPSSDRVTARAPAKLNLHLAAEPLGADGYHELRTVFHAVGLYDVLTASRTDRATVTAEVCGEGAADLPTDEDNLAVRAALLLAAETGSRAGAHLAIEKGIPVAGGCAGGSADAAAALVACDALWGTGLSMDDLHALAARLGSDVPFALHGGTALGTGRGEQLQPVPAAGSYAWVLALADGGLSTPAVYGELDRQRGSGPSAAGDPAQLLAALAAGDAKALGSALANDLQEAAMALRPALRDLLHQGLALGALGGAVTGSGPTVAFLAADPPHAAALADALTGHCRAVRVADGPVAGAQVVG